jgi:hypothetical protein
VRGWVVQARDAAGTEWRFSGTPQAHLPLRHRRALPGGGEAVLRIVKMPTRWTFGDGRQAVGITEFHDEMAGERPLDLSE